VHRCTSTSIRKLIDSLDELASNADSATGLEKSTSLDEKGGLQRLFLIFLFEFRLSSVHDYK